MLPISGTIRNTVKLAGLQQKWEQKKQNGAMAIQKDMDVEQRQILMYQEDLKRMRESDKYSSLDAKIKAGKELTTEELAYLKEKNPTAYMDYLEIRREKKAYERELKNCKTKEDVQELKVTKLGHIAAQAKSVVNNPHIPKAKKLELLGKFLAKVSNIQEVHTKFVQSGSYSSLPTEEEIAHKEHENLQSTEEVAQKAQENQQSSEHSPIEDERDEEKPEFDGLKRELTQYIEQVEGMNKEQE